MAIKIALAGNPNCGKTTLFNGLTGANQFVGNWPGVTVEKKEGRLKGHKDVYIMDLPGIYSLSPYTLEEVVARNYLIQETPDVILNIVDGTNLERNLYLTTQLAELGIPVVIAVNMMDVVRKNGDNIDTKKLGETLGCTVVEISALRNDGIMKAAEAAVAAASQGSFTAKHAFASDVEDVLTQIEGLLTGVEDTKKRWYAVKVFERDEKVAEELDVSIINKAESLIKEIENAKDDDSESIITNERYTYITSMIGAFYTKKTAGQLNTSDKIDRIVTNRILGLPIFVVVMYCVYWVAMGPFGSFLTDWTNDVFGGWLCDIADAACGALGAGDVVTGLVVDGIVAGVGAVLGFVPQMLVLFLMLCILEDCGYMARIAFVMDRIFRRFGLSGKSFIPMLVGTGCGIPGVMASRTIENERDRRMTVMTTTFMPCGAKMPIVGLIAGALFGGSGMIATSAYFLGVAAIVISGIMLKKTKPFAGEPAPFVMELPAYHLPTVGNVLRGTWERGWSFIKKAGTIILLSSVVLWFLQGFGWENGAFGMVDDMNNSVLAAIGNAICIVFAPLGFGNWKATVATITGLIAKENVVSTFGVLYQFAGEVSENGDEIWANVAADYTALTAYVFLIFNLLCAPCFAAMGAIKREMNNTKWFWAAIGYQCGLAYTVGLIVYQIGGLITGEVTFGIGTIVALLLVAGVLYMLFRPYKEATTLNVDVKVGASK